MLRPASKLLQFPNQTPMPTSLIRRLSALATIFAFTFSARSQVIELRATINATQEVPATASVARGTAIMLYDLGANAFDLIVSINGYTNTLTDAHVQEAVAGANGSAVIHFPLASFTNTGGTLTAAMRSVAYPGDKLKLLQGGAYLNYHSPQFPSGDVRGRLLAQPKRLVANMTVAQEAAAFPALNFAGLNDFGGAVMFYDAFNNRVSLRLSLYNFNNVLNNSHFHEGAPGVSGGVVVTLGNNPNATFANGGSYSNGNGHISGTFDIPYPGDVIKLLTGGSYLNFHTVGTFSGGELRGQVRASDEVAGTRFSNLSVRGTVGTGDQVLIQGITVNGPDPIRALITAKGPSLTAFGVTGVLANPRLTVYDSAGRAIASNDDVGATTGTDLANVPGVPTNSLESALLLVLPPGNYSAIVSSSTGTTGTTGTALLEVNDLRTLNGFVPAEDSTSAAVQ